MRLSPVLCFTVASDLVKPQDMGIPRLLLDSPGHSPPPRPPAVLTLGPGREVQAGQDGGERTLGLVLHSPVVHTVLSHLAL